jgi:alpha-L-arabinofuranosidase
MPHKATVQLDTNRVIGQISPLLFSGFAEHMGRCIYEGIYDPGSPKADARGFRTDVLEALKALNFRSIRYPGGNFVSGYQWLDGIGPKENRPTRRELAWRSIETNQFGTDDFMAFCRDVGTAPMMAVNLGTAGIQEAADLVEYCNSSTGTYYADLRAKNGSSDPFNVRYWCLGNEMDGPWQIGHLSALEYGAKAKEAAKLMRTIDQNLELILCGSSSTLMPTYPEWDRVTLETCWEDVDYLSLHYYADNKTDDTDSFLAMSKQFESQLDTLAATCRYVKAQKRSKHDVYLSWDEWQMRRIFSRKSITSRMRWWWRSGCRCSCAKPMS